MNKEELAALLNGREYGEEITKEEIQKAAQSGLVAVYGYSDDNMEFDGAIEDEIGCYGGGTAYLKDGKILANECNDSECPYFAEQLKTAFTITAIWDSDGYSWTYQTSIPHATFDILEGGEKYCRGIVFKTIDTF